MVVFVEQCLFIQCKHVVFTTQGHRLISLRKLILIIELGALTAGQIKSTVTSKLKLSASTVVSSMSCIIESIITGNETSDPRRSDGSHSTCNYYANQDHLVSETDFRVPFKRESTKTLSLVHRPVTPTAVQKLPLLVQYPPD